MPRFLRAVFRPLAVLVLALVLALTNLSTGIVPATGDDRVPVKVPADVHKPKDTKIPVMWRVAPGKIRFYSAQTDPEYATGAYTVEVTDNPAFGNVSMYDAPTLRMKCGRRYEVVARPFENLYPETYRIYIPCAGVSGAVSKVAAGSTTRIYGKASPSNKVRVVRVALYRSGKLIRKAKTARGKSWWRTSFPGRLPKGSYVVTARIVPIDGTVKVVKRRFVVR